MSIHDKLIQLHHDPSPAAVKAAQILDALAHDPDLQRYAASLILAAHPFPDQHKALSGVLRAVK